MLLLLIEYLSLMSTYWVLSHLTIYICNLIYVKMEALEWSEKCVYMYEFMY